MTKPTYKDKRPERDALLDVGLFPVDAHHAPTGTPIDIDGVDGFYTGDGEAVSVDEGDARSVDLPEPGYGAEVHVRLSTRLGRLVAAMQQAEIEIGENDDMEPAAVLSGPQAPRVPGLAGSERWAMRRRWREATAVLARMLVMDGDVTEHEAVDALRLVSCERYGPRASTNMEGAA